MNASGSVEACAEAGATLLSLTDVAGRGMQVEDDIGDLDDTQVAEPGSERYKEDSVAKDMLLRCAEDAACRGTFRNDGYHLSTFTRCCGTRPAHGGTGLGHGREGCGLSGETRGLCEGSLRISRQQNQQSLRISGWKTGQSRTTGVRTVEDV